MEKFLGKSVYALSQKEFKNLGKITKIDEKKVYIKDSEKQITLKLLNLKKWVKEKVIQIY